MLCPTPHAGRREYNVLVESTKDEVAKTKAVQKAAVAKQMWLDAESLQRIRAAEAAAEKVRCTRFRVVTHASRLQAPKPLPKVAELC